MEKQNSAGNKLPLSLRAVLWSRDIRRLNIKKDRAYIINQILAYGTPVQLRWLFRTYSLSVIKKTFAEQPAKIYSSAGFNFVKNILLALERRRLHPQNYVSSLPRNFR